MIITKTTDKVIYNRLKKQRANKNCNICPCCKNKEIEFEKTKTYYKGLLRIKVIKVDTYLCKSCGAKWTSEPWVYTAE